MRGTDTELRTLEGHVAALKDEYARMVQQAYRMKLGTNPLLFVFAAEDFSQAALRFRLVQSYTTVRKEQVKQIEEAQTDLAEVRVTLNEERAEVERALAEQQAERDALRADKGERTALVDQLQAEENAFGKPKSPGKRTPAPERRNQAHHRGGAGRRTRLCGRGIRPDAGRQNRLGSLRKEPTLLALACDAGVVTQGFGRQPHPTLDGITIDNNGIDITTEAGNRALSIFQGTVSSVFNLPGAGTSVIVTHGAYRTVYTNLANCPFPKAPPWMWGPSSATSAEQLGPTASCTSRCGKWRERARRSTPENG